jgi:hypothetical protein
MEGTLVSFDVRITVAELGHDSANGERFLDAFLAVAPESDPVVSQNLHDGTLTVSFACDAQDATAAVATATETFRHATGLIDAQVIAVQADLPQAA